MSVEYLTCKTQTEPTVNYVNASVNSGITNSAYKSDEPDDMNNNSSSAANPNKFLGSELREQKERSLSFHQSLPVLNKKNQTKSQMMKSVFRIRNAVAMYKGVVKRRPDKVHILLWQIIVIYVIMCICANGVSPIMLSFVQKTYGMETNFYLVIYIYF